MLPNRSTNNSAAAAVDAPSRTSSGPIRRDTQKRFRRFVFTLNNYSDKEYSDVCSLDCTWMIVAKESGENGTPHLQGAVILGKQLRLLQIKRLPGFGRAHIEEMRGSPSDSVTYCTKQDPKPFSKGTLPHPGKRNDLHSVVARIQSGESLRDLAQDVEGGAAIVKFHKGLTILRSLTSAPRDPKCPPRVFWIHGKTGTGKTRSVFELGERLFSAADIYMSSTMRWFDGYHGQPFVIFDDFRSKHVEFATLLRLTDRYPYTVEFKGGSVDWRPQFIFFTTPESIELTFATRNEHRPEDIAQLTRRVERSFCFPDDLDGFGSYDWCRGNDRSVGLDGGDQSEGSGGGEQEEEVAVLV